MTRASFLLPGWDWYSIWGYDEVLGSFYAQLTRNDVGEDPVTGRANLWLGSTPTELPSGDALVAAIAEAVGADGRAVRAAMGEESRGESAKTDAPV